MSVQTNKKGFTIIEVVLVLAIAGLIFLMVFIALPALQRSQRDSARKSEVSTVASTVTSYQGNNRGSNPKAYQIVNYITGSKLVAAAAPTDLVLESGTQVIVGAESYSSDITLGGSVDGEDAASASVLTEDAITVYYGYKCGDGAVVKGTKRQAAVATLLESGNGSAFCQTN